MPEFLKSIGQKNTLLRIIGSALLLITSIAFVMSMGCMSGVCAFIIGFMGIAGLAVALNPFRFISIQNTLILYAVSVVFELYI